MILTCVAGDDVLLDVDRIRAALKIRQNRPFLLIDLGVPRNVSPDVNDLDTAYLYDIDDLQQVAAANTEERKRESQRGEQIVLEEEQRFDGWLVALQAVPAIRHLRARADAIVAQEFERHAGGLDLEDAQLENVETLIRSIVNKILHAPLSRLRAESGREEGLAMLEAARQLFALDDTSAPGGHIDGELSSPERESGDEEEDG